MDKRQESCDELARERVRVNEPRRKINVVIHPIIELLMKVDNEHDQTSRLRLKNDGESNPSITFWIGQLDKEVETHLKAMPDIDRLIGADILRFARQYLSVHGRLTGTDLYEMARQRNLNTGTFTRVAKSGAASVQTFQAIVDAALVDREIPITLPTARVGRALATHHAISYAISCLRAKHVGDNPPSRPDIWNIEMGCDAYQLIESTAVTSVMRHKEELLEPWFQMIRQARGELSSLYDDHKFQDWLQEVVVTTKVELEGFPNAEMLLTSIAKSRTSVIAEWFAVPWRRLQLGAFLVDWKWRESE